MTLITPQNISDRLSTGLLTMNSYKRTASTKDRNDAMLDVLVTSLVNYESCIKHLFKTIPKHQPINGLFISRILEKGKPVQARIELIDAKASVGQRRGLSVFTTRVKAETVIVLRNPIHSVVQDVSLLTKDYSVKKQSTHFVSTDSAMVLSVDYVLDMVSKESNNE